MLPGGMVGTRGYRMKWSMGRRGATDFLIEETIPKATWLAAGFPYLIMSDELEGAATVNVHHYF